MYMTVRDGVNTALRNIGLAGFSGVAVVAPNAIRGLELLLKKTNVVNQRRILAELKRQGLVDIVKNQSGMHYTITPAGAHRLQKLEIDELFIIMPKKWDKKWRLVTFNIPKDFNYPRMLFVEQLKRLGFYMLQKNMWAHPAPCFEQIEHLAGYYNLMRYCTLIEVAKLDQLSTQKLYRKFADRL